MWMLSRCLAVGRSGFRSLAMMRTTRTLLVVNRSAPAASISKPASVQVDSCNQLQPTSPQSTGAVKSDYPHRGSTENADYECVVVRTDGKHALCCPENEQIKHVLSAMHTYTAYGTVSTWWVGRLIFRLIGYFSVIRVPRLNRCLQRSKRTPPSLKSCPRFRRNLTAALLRSRLVPGFLS
jgi:hypothetical protein